MGPEDACPNALPTAPAGCGPSGCGVADSSGGDSGNSASLLGIDAQKHVLPAVAPMKAISGNAGYRVTNDGSLLFGYSISYGYAFNDPRRIELAVVQNALAGGATFSALPEPIAVTTHGQVDGVTCRTAAVTTSSGAKRYYRKHSNANDGDWIPEIGYSGSLTKTEDGWVETLDANTITYNNDGRITQVEIGATGAVHTFTYSTNQVTIEANTVKPSRAVITTTGTNYTPTLVSMQVEGPTMGTWVTTGTTTISMGQNLSSVTTAGCTVSLTCETDGRIAYFSNSDGQEWAVEYWADAPGNTVSKVTNPDQNEFHYYPPGAATASQTIATTNERDAMTYYHYDGSNIGIVGRADGAVGYFGYEEGNRLPVAVTKSAWSDDILSVRWFVQSDSGNRSSVAYKLL